MILRLLLLVFILLIALGIGLILRRLLVRRLRNTFLDNWLIQTIGVILVFPPLILAAVISPFILENTLILGLWDAIRNQLQLKDVSGFVGGFIQTILVLVLGVGIARTIMKLTIRGLGDSRIDVNIRTLIGRILYIIVMIIAIFWLLSIWQISIALPVAVLGTLTVAFTFAIQDIIKDLVAGFYILLERPFHIGDQINIGSTVNTPLHTGTVEDVQIRATKLRLISGEQVMVPNAVIFGGIVINNSYYSERRVTISMTLPEGEFIKDETPEKIIKTLTVFDAILLKPEPTLMISGYTGKLVTITVHFWIAANGKLASISEVLYTLHTVYPNADLSILESAGDI